MVSIHLLQLGQPGFGSVLGGAGSVPGVGGVTGGTGTGDDQALYKLGNV